MMSEEEIERAEIEADMQAEEEYERSIEEEERRMYEDFMYDLKMEDSLYHYLNR